METKYFGYYDDWKSDILTCPKCGWSGTFMQGSVEHHNELMDCSCPDCDCFERPMLAIVSYPTNEEMEANINHLSEHERRELAYRKHVVDSFQKNCLKTADQLPDLADAQITLSWGVDKEGAADSQTIIRYGEQVVWSEPLIWEGYERFKEVVALLKEKYGDRLVDVVPTAQGEAYLCGDRWNARDFVEQVRKGIRSGV